jgi:hypothetical protein
MNYKKPHVQTGLRVVTFQIFFREYLWRIFCLCTNGTFCSGKKSFQPLLWRNAVELRSTSWSRISLLSGILVQLKITVDIYLRKISERKRSQSTSWWLGYSKVIQDSTFLYLLSEMWRELGRPVVSLSWYPSLTD